MILSRGSYGLHPAGNMMFRVNDSTLELSSNLLGPRVFACRVLAFFVSHVVIFLAVVNELTQSERAVLKRFTKSFVRQ